MDIRVADLENPEVLALLREHLASLAPTAPAESRHALDLSGFRNSDITFWSIWDGQVLAGFGALKQLTASHAEVKSMRTATSHLRQGVASKMLRHLVQEAAAHVQEPRGQPGYRHRRRWFDRAGLGLVRSQSTVDDVAWMKATASFDRDLDQ